MFDDPFYGRMFFSPDGDGGGAGGGSAGGGGDQGGGDEQSGAGDAGDDSGGDSQDDGAGDQKAGEDVSGLKTALQSERQTNDAIKKYARDNGISIPEALKRLTDAEDANRTELERAQNEATREKQRADAAIEQLRTANARATVTAAATTANAISTNAIFALIRQDLEFDDEGKPTNVDALIAAARKADPALFKAAGGRTDAAARDQDDDKDVKPGTDRMSRAYASSSSRKR